MNCIKNFFIGIKNRILYIYRVFIKVFSFLFFGIGSLLLFSLVYPIMHLIFYPIDNFQKYARIVTSKTLSFFVFFMRFFGALSVSIDNKEFYKNLNSKIVVANHPSLIDVVFLISLIPNANCIVRSGLSKTIVGGIIKNLYIPNSLDFDELVLSCKKSLEKGECLIIFPEGTRTPADEEILPLKKGFARIAISSGCDIVPVLIGGNRKTGLKKKDPLFYYNPKEKWHYSFTMKDTIKVDRFKDLPVQVAVKHISDEVKSLFVQAKNSDFES